MSRILACALTVALVGLPASAQVGTSTARPRIEHGTVVDEAATGGLAAVVRTRLASATDPVWIGYAVPVTDGDHDMCCWGDGGSGRGGGCRLEPRAESAVTDALPSPPSGPVQLEPSDALAVMLRLEAGRVERIRTFSASCPLEAGSRRVYWLSGVRPAESVALLGGYAREGETRRIQNGALSGIALHAAPEALDWLLGAARTGATAHLRSQALFWLSQRAGQRAVGAIAEAIERDPDIDVKKRAVFALSQLPPDDGVPRLITLARSHSNPVVRKQAFFWLGQSRDPRALTFFAEVLTK